MECFECGYPVTQDTSVNRDHRLCFECAGVGPLDTELDDAYDVTPSRGGKLTKRGTPINNRMGTLNRVQGMLNRHRNAGRIK